MSQAVCASRIEVDTESLGEVSEQLKSAGEMNQDLALEVGIIAAKVLATLTLDPLGQGAEAGSILTATSVRFAAFSESHRALAGSVGTAMDSYLEVERFANSILDGPEGFVPELFYVAGKVTTSDGWVGEKLADKVPGAPLISQVASRLLFGAGYYADIKYNGEQFARRRRNERMAEAGMSPSWRRDAGQYLLGISQKSGMIRDLEESSIRSQRIDGNSDYAEATDGMILMPTTAVEWASNLQRVSRGEDKLDELNKDRGEIIEHDGVRVQVVRDGNGKVVAANVYIPGTDSNSDPYKGGLATWPSNTQMLSADGLETLDEATPMMQLTDRALQEAGIGSDVPVNMGGFSQGAGTAKALSTNKEFRSKYKLNYLYLQGGPVGDLKTDPYLPTTVVKDKRDLVPMLQGNSTDADQNGHTTTINTDYNALERSRGEEKIFDTPVHGYNEYVEVTAATPIAYDVQPEMEILKNQMNHPQEVSVDTSQQSAHAHKLPAGSPSADNFIVSGSSFADGTTPDEIELNRTLGFTAGGYQIVEDILDNTLTRGAALPDLPEDFSAADTFSTYIAPLSDETKMHLNMATVGPLPLFWDYKEGMFDTPPPSPSQSMEPTISRFATYTPASVTG